MRSIGILLSTVLTVSLLTAQPATATENPIKDPEIPDVSLPEKSLVTEVQLLSDQTADPTQQRVKLTAVTDAPVEQTEDFLKIVNKNTGETVKTCGEGTECVYEHEGQDSTEDVTYYAQTTRTTSNSIQVVSKVPSVTLTIDKEVVDSRERYTIKATIEEEFSSRQAVYIVKEDTGEVVTKCGYFDFNAGRLCTIGSDFDGLEESFLYRAYIADDAWVDNYSQLTGIIASSNTVTVSRTPWVITLNSNIPFVEDAGYFWIEARSNQVIPAKLDFYLYNETIQKFVGTDEDSTYCLSDSEHQRCQTNLEARASDTYTAYLALKDETITKDSSPEELQDIRAISNTVTVKKLPWLLQLEAEPRNGDQVRFVGKHNHKLAYFYDAIIDNSNGQILQICKSHYGCTAEGPDWWNGYPTTEYPLTEGVSYVIGKWSEEGNGVNLGELRPGYMYDIQKSVSLSLDTNPGSPATGSTPGLNNPHNNTGGSNPSQPCAQTCVADPINAVTGEFWLNHTDLQTDSSTPLTLTRNYSISNRNNQGIFGHGWTTAYDMKIQATGDDPLSEASQVTISQENGSLISFTKNEIGVWETDLKTRATLETTPEGGFLLTRNKETKFTFDSSGKLTAVQDLNNNTISLSYTNNQLTTVSNGSQNLSFTWNSHGVDSVTTTGGETVSYTYDDNSNLIKVTYEDGGARNYNYDTDHVMTKFSDPAGNYTENEYDDKKRVTQQTDPAGNTTTISYEAGKTVITNPNGREDEHHYNELGQVYLLKQGDDYYESYEFDAANNLTKTTYPDNGTVEATYDVDGNVLQSKDRAGNITTFTYNDLNRPLTVTNAAGKTQTFEYDANGNLIASTDFNGNTTTHVVNPDGTVQKTVLPNNGEISYTYNSQRLTETVTQPNGSVTTYSYTADGLPETITDPVGNTISYAYNSVGLVKEITHPNGHSESFTYDKNGNVLTETDREGNTTTYVYDTLNRVTSITDPEGNTTTTEYDSMGNVVKTVDALNNATTHEYDELGRLTATYDPDDGDISYEYNQLGWLIQVTDYRISRYATTVYNYDANGNLVETVDANGVETKTVYNNLNLPEKTIDVQGKETSYTYDNNGNVLTIKHPDFTTETNVYNSVNQVTQHTDENGGVRKWEYDTTGLKTKFVNTNGEETSYTYDAAGNLKTITRPDSSQITYDYQHNQVVKETTSDAVTEYTYTPNGFIHEEKQGTDIIEYGYDGNGNITSRGPPAGNKVEYTYTARGQVATITYPSGKTVTYEYDNRGNLTSANNIETGAFTYEYERSNFLATATNPNGTTQTYEYDSAGNSTKTQIAGPSSSYYTKNYTYDDRSGLLSQTRTTYASNTVTENYSYDTRLRLSNVASTSTLVPTGNYGYSPNGNLTNNLGEEQTYDAGNRLTTTPTSSNEFDGRGNRTSRTTGTETTTYTYNQANKLIEAETPESVVQYEYDANGLLKTRSAGTETDEFVWDYNSGVPLLLDDGEYEYIYTVYNHPVAQINKTTDEVTYLHSDVNGSIAVATDEAGARVAQYAYTAYGELNLQLSTDDEREITRFGYVGEWTDPDTGLYNLRARWYEPETGTFLSRDPLEEATAEAYSYTSGNPLLYSDPLGLWSIKDPFNFTSDELGTVSTATGLLALGLAFTPLAPIAGVLAGISAAASLTSSVVAVSEGNVQNAVLGLVGGIPGIGIGVTTAARTTLRTTIHLKLTSKFKEEDSLFKHGWTMPDASLVRRHNKFVKSEETFDLLDKSILAANAPAFGYNTIYGFIKCSS